MASWSRAAPVMHAGRAGGGSSYSPGSSGADTGQRVWLIAVSVDGDALGASAAELVASHLCVNAVRGGAGDDLQ